MVWIDGLDVPFVQALQQISFDPYKGRLPVNEAIDPSLFLRHDPAGRRRHARTPHVLHYHWRDTYPSLQRLARTSGNAFDGAALEFVNPATGGPTLPTMSCRVQMLRPNEKTKSHRHTSTSIYHAFRGSGTTMINGEISLAKRRHLHRAAMVVARTCQCVIERRSDFVFDARRADPESVRLV